MLDLDPRESYPLDQPAAEDAVGPDHEHQDHQEIGREILGAAADIGIEIASGQVLDNADDQSTDHGTDHGVEPAENDHGKDFEPDDAELVVDAEHGAPNYAAQCRDDARHRP